MNKLLSLNNISKTYYTPKGKVEAIKDISFDVYQGQIIGIVGSSGCGKSTLLNIIDELDKNYKGNIIKEDIKMSYMLQSDALLPWLTVLDNALIGLKLENNLTKENIEYVKNLLIKFGLEKFIYLKPTQLSGGMKQRVALVRTLSTKPDIILLDEPLSALDYVTRLTITDEIYNILKELNTTTILITHDIAECISVSDKVIVLSKRPAIIKNIYNINLPKDNLPSQNRHTDEFFKYYNLIWGDLDK